VKCDCFICVAVCSCLQTDISSIQSQPNMCYNESSGKVFARKSDYINSIVRSCARKLLAFQVILVILH
jgi:hypothetical protein